MNLIELLKVSAPEEYVECMQCNGKGFIYHRFLNDYGEQDDTDVPCYTCREEGFILCKRLSK